MSESSAEPVNTPEGIAIIIFGVTGDLTRRKLAPALYELHRAGRLPMPVYTIGFARREWSDDFLRQTLREGVVEFGKKEPLDEGILQALLERSYYVRSTFDDPDGYARLEALIKDLKVKNVLFYLATPPDSYVDIIRQLEEQDLCNGQPGWTRIVIEKPYGRTWLRPKTWKMKYTRSLKKTRSTASTITWARKLSRTS